MPYYYLKNLMAIEAIGYERDANGMLVIHLPAGASMNPNDPNSDFSKASEVGRNVRNDEQGALIEPEGWEFKLLSGAGKSFAQLDAAINRYTRWCTMAMLSQWLMLGSDSVGSYSLSVDMTKQAEMIVHATADIIAETFTKQELPRIRSMNGFDPSGVRLEHTPAGETDIVLGTATLMVVFPQGAMSLRFATFAVVLLAVAQFFRRVAFHLRRARGMGWTIAG